jgi:hypothetical protein
LFAPIDDVANDMRGFGADRWKNHQPFKNLLEAT